MNVPPHTEDDQSSRTDPHGEEGVRGVSVTVVRDAVMIFILTVFGGVVISFGVTPLLGHGIVRSVILFCAIVLMLTTGFAFSACLAHGNRWYHLVQVAIAVWLIGEAVSFFYANNSLGHTQGSVDFVFWVAQVAIPMLLGGALSYFFKHRDG